MVSFRFGFFLPNIRFTSLRPCFRSTAHWLSCVVFHTLLRFGAGPQVFVFAAREIGEERRRRRAQTTRTEREREFIERQIESS
jgi:hypothetical protein